MSTEIEQIVNDEETKVACCKLLATLFYKQAKLLNATNITFSVDEITLKEDGKNIGSIKVEWVLESEQE